MKKLINLKLLNLSGITSAAAVFASAFVLSSIGFTTEGSFEVMCRNKAKEIAAENYKGCMTEYRQTQLEQIRKEYKEELSNLKNQYDKKLKRLSGNNQKTDEDSRDHDKDKIKESTTTSTIELKRTKTRASRARLPVKSVGSGTQVIDLSKSIDSQINGPDETVESARYEKRESSDQNETEPVELANQQ